ncbi:hypothetical protein PRZ48_014025 [Zasmidium cellare]|uniref:Uncharacterized protein n=1 Tax=Zasmidium cellare TaxID=395010 RepID=A0ABR0DZZ6_ZASCE|nr:hypothetical protein PRZ48_014025 [Zasmidium cellare]
MASNDNSTFFTQDFDYIDGAADFGQLDFNFDDYFDSDAYAAAGQDIQNTSDSLQSALGDPGVLQTHASDTNPENFSTSLSLPVEAQEAQNQDQFNDDSTNVLSSPHSANQPSFHQSEPHAIDVTANDFTSNDSTASDLTAIDYTANDYTTGDLTGGSLSMNDSPTNDSLVNHSSSMPLANQSVSQQVPALEALFDRLVQRYMTGEASFEEVTGTAYQFLQHSRVNMASVSFMQHFNAAMTRHTTDMAAVQQYGQGGVATGEGVLHIDDQPAARSSLSVRHQQDSASLSHKAGTLNNASNPQLAIDRSDRNAHTTDQLIPASSQDLDDTVSDATPARATPVKRAPKRKAGKKVEASSGTTSSRERGHKLKAAGKAANVSVDRESDEVEAGFEDMLKDLNDTKEQEERDVFAVAEEWVKQCDLVIVPYPFDSAKDDVNEVMMPDKVVEIAEKIRGALTEDYDEPGEGWKDDEIEYYHKQQKAALKRLLKVLDGSHGKKKALVQAIRLVKSICKVHTEGIPRVDLPANRPETATRFTYYTELDLKCSERCQKVIESVRANKNIGLDVMEGEARKMTDFARCPMKYLYRKVDNVTTNTTRQQQIEEGKKGRRGPNAPGKKSSDPAQDLAELDTEAGAEIDTGAEVRVVSKRKSSNTSMQKRQGKTAKSGKRTRATLTEQDGEEQDEATSSQTAKRPRTAATDGSAPKERNWRGSGRKRKGVKPASNFTTSTENTPAAAIEQSSRAMPPPVGLGISVNSLPISTLAVNGSSQDRPIDLSSDSDEPTVSTSIHPGTSNAQASLGATDFGGGNESDEQHVEGDDTPPEYPGQDLLSHVGTWTATNSAGMEDYWAGLLAPEVDPGADVSSAQMSDWQYQFGTSGNI